MSDVSNIPNNMSLKDRAKAEAQKEVQEERFKDIKFHLKALYRKRAAAEQVIKNIDNEIADYEMEIAQEV